ncbi:MAG: hypothetical protein ACLT3Y_08270 [Ruminococcus callidus]
MMQEILTDIFLSKRYNEYTNDISGISPQSLPAYPNVRRLQPRIFSNYPEKSADRTRAERYAGRRSAKKGRFHHAQPQPTSAPPSHPVPRILRETGGGFLSGLLLAGTYMGTMTSPLPIAIAANLSAPGAIAVLIGSLISYTLSNTMLDNLPLLFALVVVVCLRLLKRPAKTAAGMACSTGICVFLSGIAVSLVFHASGAEVIGYTMTAALTGCASYFMHAVFSSVRSTGKIPCAPPTDAPPQSFSFWRWQHSAVTASRP